MIDLYRMWNREGELLYIGISLHAAVRMMDHRRLQPWWHEVERIDVEHLDVTRQEAERLERRAIAAESPRYNIANVADPSPHTRKFTCATCGRGIAQWGLIVVSGLDRSGSPAERMQRAFHRVLEQIAADASDGWRALHPIPRCRVPYASGDVVLSTSDVWALLVGARPTFLGCTPELVETLVAMWEQGDL